MGQSALERQIKTLNKQRNALVERLVKASNPKVITALETKVTKLENDKLLLNGKLTQETQSVFPPDEIIELLREFLSNHCNIYAKGSLLVRKTILKAAFKAPLAYERKNG